MVVIRESIKPPFVKSNPLHTHVWNRLYVNNRNFLAVFTGDTGSGKTYSAMKMAWDLDRELGLKPRFNVDRIVFNPLDFFKLVNTKLRKGSFIIWDEAGVGINARAWQSIHNKLISHVIQTFRYKNLGVIFTVPHFGYVDKQVRGLFHAKVEMDWIDYKNNRSYGRWYWLDQSSEGGEVYKKYPRFINKGKKELVDSVSFAMPPEKLWRAYEEKRKNATEDWYAEYVEVLKYEMEKLKDVGKTSSIVDEVYEKIKESSVLLNSVWNFKRGEPDKDLIRKVCLDVMGKQIGGSSATAVKKFLLTDLKAGVLKEPTL